MSTSHTRELRSLVKGMVPVCSVPWGPPCDGDCSYHAVEIELANFVFESNRDCPEIADTEARVVDTTIVVAFPQATMAYGDTDRCECCINIRRSLAMPT